MWYFQKSKIEKSKVFRITIIGGLIPIDSSKVFTSDDKKVDYVQLANPYNQLYLAMKNQGSRDHEIKYYAAYMENHRLFLKKFKKEKSTRISLSLHKVSTNYGQDWSRGLWIVFLLGLILFYWYFISLFEYEFTFTPKWNRDLINLFTAKYFEFLLPTHSLDFVVKSPNACAVFIDIFSRIVIGFFIYQIISAFRKFGKG